MNNAIYQFIRSAEIAASIALQNQAVASFLIDHQEPYPTGDQAKDNLARDVVRHVMRCSGGSADPNRINALVHKLLDDEAP